MLSKKKKKKMQSQNKIWNKSLDTLIDMQVYGVRFN